MSTQIPVITIDGPSGTGKGTISQLLAQKLNWHFLDSGALYRVLAHASILHHVELTDEESLTVLAEHLDVNFVATATGDAPRIWLEGTDVTDAIRTETCGNAASQVAAIESVRQALLARQRAFCRSPGLVTDGRDMGTVVFPKAMLKIYLDASDQARAERRHRQLKEKGINVTIARVLEDLRERDSRDRDRRVAPLKPAKDAVVIDTTHLHIEQVLDQVLGLAKTRIAEFCAAE